MQFGRGMCAILLVLPLFMLVPQPASPFAVGANSGNFQVDPADCSSTVGVDAIRISPTGHRSITSDQTIDFNAILFDAGGGDVEGKVYWSSSSGLIDRETGFFVPAETGSVTVAACAGNEVEMTTVTVRQGATISLEIESEIHSITTDETLDLVLWAVDSKGNRELALIPMMNMIQRIKKGVIVNHFNCIRNVILRISVYFFSKAPCTFAIIFSNRTNSPH